MSKPFRMLLLGGLALLAFTSCHRRLGDEKLESMRAEWRAWNAEYRSQYEKTAYDSRHSPSIRYRAALTPEEQQGRDSLQALVMSTRIPSKNWKEVAHMGLLLDEARAFLEAEAGAPSNAALAERRWQQIREEIKRFK